MTNIILIVMWVVIGVMQTYIQYCDNNCPWTSYWVCYIMTMILLLEQVSWGG